MREFNVISLFILFFVSDYAYAYIDPGTGSIVIQVVIGSIVGGYFFLKNFWKTFLYKIKFLSKKE